MPLDNNWDKGTERMFKDMATKFDESSTYHHNISKKWKVVFTVCTLVTMTLSFSALCLELLLRDHPFIKYYNFSEKIASILTLAFLYSINPGDIASNHDKSSSEYLKMVSRISTQLNRDIKNRKNADTLLTEIRTKHDFTIERTRPPKHLNFPTAIYKMSDSDKNILGDLYLSSSSINREYPDIC